jgi:hypothetical protein
VDQVLQQAGVKVVESADDRIEFGTSSGGAAAGNSSSAILSAQNDVARQLVGALSIMFGVEVANDVFSKKGYQNDAWGARGSQMSRNVLVGV